MPIRDFLADASGDLAVVHGDFATVADADAVAQGIGGRLRLFQTEVWYNEALGVPYLDDILIKDPNPVIVRAELADQIAATPDVTQVVGGDLVQGADRHATIDYTVRTIYSTEPIDGTVTV